MQLLCTVDFSRHSSQALGYAVKLANLLNARLHILHVYKISKTLKPKIVAKQERMKAWSKHQDEMAKTLAGIVGLLKADAPPITSLVEGKTAKSIKKYVKENMIDILVIGSQGRHAIQNRIYGSTAVKLIKKIKVPILVVPESASELILPIRVLLALDNKTIKNEPAFHLLRRILELSEKEIDIIHINNKEETDFPFDPFVTYYLKDFIGEIYLIKNSDIDFSLVHFTKVNDYDLLVMLRRTKSFLSDLMKKSHSIEEVKRSFVPILVIPELK